MKLLTDIDRFFYYSLKKCWVEYEMGGVTEYPLAVSRYSTNCWFLFMNMLTLIVAHKTYNADNLISVKELNFLQLSDKILNLVVYVQTVVP